MNFVDRVLFLHHVPEMEKLSIWCKKDYNPSRVNAWMKAIASRNVKDIDVRFSEVRLRFNEWFRAVADGDMAEPQLNCVSELVKGFDQPLPVNSPPDSFYNLANLTHLNIYNMLLNVPESVHFPNLDTLALIGVQWRDDSSLMKLLVGSPVLRYLFIRTEIWDNAQTYYLRSRSLTLLYVDTETRSSKNLGYRVVVETPSLEILHLSNHIGDEYFLENISSLKTAGLEIEQDGEVLPDTNALKDRRLLELIGKLSKVEELELSHRTLNSLNLVTVAELPIFHNLIRLKVKVVDDWKLLPILLECAPNLITLVSTKDPNSEPNEDEYGWTPPTSVPKCLQSCLKKIEFNNFEYYADELEMIEYFLKNAMVLKRMWISSKNLDLETQSVALREILMFPRSSNDCRVIFS